MYIYTYIYIGLNPWRRRSPGLTGDLRLQLGYKSEVESDLLNQSTSRYTSTSSSTSTSTHTST